MSIFDAFIPDNYKPLMAIPIILLVLSLGLLGWMIYSDGLNLDVDLQGGTQISLEFSEPVSVENIKSVITAYNPSVRSATGFTGQTIIIDVDESTDSEALVADIEDAGYKFKGWSQQTVGPALGASFFTQAQFALLIAFIAMAITVLIVFRSLMPSLYVVLSAFSDIVETLVISQLLGINLSLATFAALLLLLGYSVDTDVLLTTRILKTRGEQKDKIRKAMRTGLTMTITTLAALTALYFIAGTGIISQIALILLIGLLLDVINTWLMNVNLLRWYIEKNPHKALR